jgi:hypothetical protein
MGTDTAIKLFVKQAMARIEGGIRKRSDEEDDLRRSMRATDAVDKADSEKRKKKEKLLRELQRKSKTLRYGDTGYSPSMLNWALGGGLLGGGLGAGLGYAGSNDDNNLTAPAALLGAGSGALGAAVAAWLAKQKLMKLRTDKNEQLPSPSRAVSRSAGWGAGLGAGLSGLLTAAAVANNGANWKEALVPTAVMTGAGGIAGALGGSLIGALGGAPVAATNRIAARRAGLLRDTEGAWGSTADRIFGLGMPAAVLAQNPQYNVPWQYGPLTDPGNEYGDPEVAGEPKGLLGKYIQRHGEPLGPIVDAKRNAG